MFPTRKRMVLLHLSGQVVRTTPDHPFFIHGQGWSNAAELLGSNPLRPHDGWYSPIEAVTDRGE